jgi:hypothetical protein
MIVPVVSTMIVHAASMTVLSVLAARMKTVPVATLLALSVRVVSMGIVHAASMTVLSVLAARTKTVPVAILLALSVRVASTVHPRVVSMTGMIVPVVSTMTARAGATTIAPAGPTTARAAIVTPPLLSHPPPMSCWSACRPRPHVPRTSTA